MSDYVIGSIIGVCGVVFGALLSFASQVAVSTINHKKEKERALMQLKIDTYADATRYISLCRLSYTYEHTDQQDEYVKTVQIFDEMYKKFYPVFAIISDEKTIKNFNELRNLAMGGEITQEEAHQKVLRLLKIKTKDVKLPSIED